MNQEKFISVQELAVLLNLSTRTIYQKLWKRELPSYKIGGRVLFDKDEIDLWITRTRRPSIYELKEEADSLLNRRGRA